MLGCLRMGKQLLFQNAGHPRWRRVVWVEQPSDLADPDSLAPEWQLSASVCLASSGATLAWKKGLVWYSSCVIPLKQNISSASLSLLTSFPMSENMKANLLSFTVQGLAYQRYAVHFFSACHKKPKGTEYSALWEFWLVEEEEHDKGMNQRLQEQEEVYTKRFLWIPCHWFSFLQHWFCSQVLLMLCPSFSCMVCAELECWFMMRCISLSSALPSCVDHSLCMWHGASSWGYTHVWKSRCLWLHVP